jgi:nitrate reductase gamma subunit
MHILSWIKAAAEPSAGPVTRNLNSDTVIEIILDIILFRRLYKTNKVLWLASFMFHISLFFVVVRHLRYFVYPVPALIISMQDAGIYAGYVLPISLLLLIIIRITVSKDRYVSFYNYFLLSTLFLTGVTGILLKLFYRTGLVDIKAFMLGVVSFTPETAPDSTMFIVHFLLVLLLIPAIPFHLLTAPVITIDARRREQGLKMVIHEKK